jgi:hypothetical protein
MPGGGGERGSARAAGRAAILGVAAVVILALAGGMVDTEVRCTFMGDLDVRRMSPVMRPLIAVIGAIGHLARAVALAVIGLLVARAALFGNARRAGGLDAALRLLGDTGPGSVLLIVVALGLTAYGISAWSMRSPAGPDHPVAGDGSGAWRAWRAVGASNRHSRLRVADGHALWPAVLLSPHVNVPVMSPPRLPLHLSVGVWCRQGWARPAHDVTHPGQYVFQRCGQGGLTFLARPEGDAQHQHADPGLQPGRGIRLG